VINDDRPTDDPRDGHRLARLAAMVATWIDPEENPSGVVYGTIAVGAVLAAESTRSDTYGDTVEATVLILLLYWVAHAYAAVVGLRVTKSEPLSAGDHWRVFLHEGAIVKGAATPIAVLLVLWGAGVSFSTAVNAALWSSAGVLAAFETVLALRRDIGGWQRVGQVLVGTLLGAGILLIHLLLH
jgi:hypothetical protein